MEKDSPMAEDDDQDSSIPYNHKLIGFLLAAVSSPNNLPSLTPCHVGPSPGFISDNGTHLSPINSVPEKKGRAVGSVVNQLHTLIKHKCLSLVSRVVGVVRREEEIRAVVMVDVYLPVEVWDGGWQFPKSGPIAAAVFSHLRCA